MFLRRQIAADLAARAADARRPAVAPARSGWWRRLRSRAA
jgi:hypothetical protein